MHDTAALRHRSPQSVPSWLKAQAEHAPASSRLLWGLLVGYTLFFLGDVASTLVVYSAVAAKSNIPMWRQEWNPLMAAVMRAGGTTGWLVIEGACPVVL